MSIFRQRRGGFTLLELLVAASISIVIVLMLGTMFGSLTNTATRANERTDAFRDARAALQMMARDLSSLVKAQPAPYFEIDTDLAGPHVRQLYALVAAKNTPTGVSTNNAGDLCAVRYYCSWDTKGYSLHRSFRDSDLTLKSFQKNLVAGAIVYPAGNQFQGDLYYGSGATDEAIAAYCWNLQITAYDTDGKILDSQTSGGVTTTMAPYICDPNGSVKPLPASIEISFKAISTNAARSVIAATSKWSNAYDVWKVADNQSPGATEKRLYDNLIAPHAYDFRTRVYLK